MLEEFLSMKEQNTKYQYAVATNGLNDKDHLILC